MQHARALTKHEAGFSVLPQRQRHTRIAPTLVLQHLCRPGRLQQPAPANLLRPLRLHHPLGKHAPRQMRHGQHLRRQGLQRARDIECQLLPVRINTAQQPHAAGTAAGIVQA